MRGVRRFIRRNAASAGQPKGEGKGKRAGAYLASLTDDEAIVLFKGGKGKGKGKNRSSGKGKGGKKNPLGRDGRTMECWECGGDDHMAQECPHKGQGKGKGIGNSTQTNLFTNASIPDSGPLAGIISQDVFMLSNPDSSPAGSNATHSWEIPTPMAGPFQPTMSPSQVSDSQTHF